MLKFVFNKPLAEVRKSLGDFQTYVYLMIFTILQMKSINFSLKNIDHCRILLYDK